MATAWSQNHYRVRHDDGGEVSATWFAAIDTDIFIQAGHTFRVRFDITETGTTAATLTGQLRCAKNGGAFQSVTASSTIAKAVAGTNSVNGLTTTQQLGAETFVAGNIDAQDGRCAATGSIAQNSGTELEFCVQLVPTSTAADDTVQFRVYVSPTTAFGTYSKTPTITVVPPNKLNNYFYVNAGDGISVPEKIR